MKTINLDRVLRELYQEELAAAPKRHRWETDNCPPLTMFHDGVRHGWPEKYRDHVPNCPYCQMVTAMEWETHHPGLFRLAQHATGTLRDKEAMRIHLDEDRCEACKKLLESSKVKYLGGLIRGGGRALEEIRAIADRAAVITADFAWGASFAAQTPPPLQARSVSEDGNLIATLRETPERKLAVRVQSPDARNAGRGVRVDLVYAGSVLERRELIMKDRAELGSGEEWEIGQMDRFKDPRGIEVDVDWADEQSRK